MKSSVDNESLLDFIFHFFPTIFMSLVNCTFTFHFSKLKLGVVYSRNKVDSLYILKLGRLLEIRETVFFLS